VSVLIFIAFRTVFSPFSGICPAIALLSDALCEFFFFFLAVIQNSSYLCIVKRTKQ